MIDQPPPPPSCPLCRIAMVTETNGDGGATYRCGQCGSTLAYVPVARRAKVA